MFRLTDSVEKILSSPSHSPMTVAHVGQAGRSGDPPFLASALHLHTVSMSVRMGAVAVIEGGGLPWGLCYHTT